MKEIKIALSGEKEEQIAQHIMKSVYEAINEHGYCDINLCADTIPEPRKNIQIPTFLTQYARGGVIENGNDKRKRGSRTSWMPRKEQTNEYSLQEDDKPRVNQYPGGNEERTWH